MPCSLLEGDRLITLVMGVVSISETSISVCETTQLIIAEDSHLYTRRENLKSHHIFFLLTRVLDLCR